MVMAMGVADSASAAEYDRYGGWTKLKGTKTGFFHTQEIGGRWWLVSPEGNAFFSKGVCHVDYQGDMAPKLGYSPYNRAVAAKYKTADRWAKETVKRLRGWGLNTAGAWCSAEVGNHGIAYAPILDLAAASVPNLWLQGGFPDVFAPSFREKVEAQAKRRCAGHADDPWLLGYFTDNEMHWGPDWRSRDSLLEMFLKMPEDSPGRKRAEAFMAERGNPDGTHTDADRQAFLELAAGEYFRICRDAIRAADLHHLILGCRFAGFPSERVLRAMKESVDVVSYHSYNHEPPLDRLREITTVTGRPTMVTEFSFRGADSGLPNTKGAGAPVPTQKDRADGYERYVTGLANLPNCVGYHWFEYADEPKEGRFDGEDGNYGLVKIDDTEWDVLVDRFRTVNRHLDRVHANTTP